jgi:CP family cyanate transporter-like MFS transporter
MSQSVMQTDVDPSEASQDAPDRTPSTGSRVLLVVGVVLLAITLRYAVTGLSPLLPVIRRDLGLGVAGASFLGMLPTLSFGVGGLIASVIARRYSPELVAVIAMAAAAVGAIGRAFTQSTVLFFVLSAVALLGMGFGNVVGAPLVKKYFSDRQGPLLTTFALLMQAGATLPAMTALPVADTAGWRVSIASWGLLSVLAIIPWAIQLVRKPAEQHSDSATLTAARGLSFGQLVAAPVALGTALFYAMASFNTYGSLAWLPTILIDGGQTLAGAASLFSLYTFLTLPMAFISPLIATRMKKPFVFAGALAVVHAIGYLGLVAQPGAAVVWVAIMGLGGGAFPTAIAMFNRRTRTAEGSAALSGFSMGLGYLFGTLGPLMGGWLFSASGGWTIPMLVFAATGLLMLLGAFIMTREVLLEDQVAHRTSDA